MIGLGQILSSEDTTAYRERLRVYLRQYRSELIAELAAFGIELQWPTPDVAEPDSDVSDWHDTLDHDPLNGTFSAIQGLLTSRLLAGESAPPPRNESAERLLTAEEVAHALGVTRRWVQRRARRLPFARQISDHAIRYSEAGLRRWMANRHVHAA